MRAAPRRDPRRRGERVTAGPGAGGGLVSPASRSLSCTRRAPSSKPIRPATGANGSGSCAKRRCSGGFFPHGCSERSALTLLVDSANRCDSLYRGGRALLRIHLLLFVSVSEVQSWAREPPSSRQTVPEQDLHRLRDCDGGVHIVGGSCLAVWPFDLLARGVSTGVLRNIVALKRSCGQDGGCRRSPNLTPRASSGSVDRRLMACDSGVARRG